MTSHHMIPRNFFSFPILGGKYSNLNTWSYYRKERAATLLRRGFAFDQVACPVRIYAQSNTNMFYAWVHNIV